MDLKADLWYTVQVRPATAGTLMPWKTTAGGQRKSHSVFVPSHTCKIQISEWNFQRILSRRP